MDALNPSQLSELINQYAIPWGINLVTALLVFYIGRWVARMLTKGIKSLMERSSVDETLRDFLGNITYTLLLIVVAIASLEQLGIDTTSAMAILAAAGLAVGMAMKDTLSNFSAGVMLIMFKPFKSGDFIDAGGVMGVVEKISVFSTVMRTPDNREIIVPNSGIYGNTITNFSARDTRRVDLVFGIGYGDDIRKAKQLIEDVLNGDERILDEPEPLVAVGELGDSSVNLNVRPWVNSDDYWPVYFDLLEKVKLTFDINGITIPYPQMDIHPDKVALLQDAQKPDRAA